MSRLNVGIIEYVVQYSIFVVRQKYYDLDASKISRYYIKEIITELK